MADDAKGRKGGSLTWLWMILAVVVVAGFLVWLGTASEPSAVTIVEDDEGNGEAGGSPAGPAFVEVPKDTLAADKARYEGQRIRVPRVEATNALGSAMFLGELGDLENQVPILVRLDSAAAEGFQTETGARYTITGMLNPMSDSLAGVWDEQGEFTGEGERMLATFSDYYIQASQIRRSRGGPAPAGQGAAAGDTAG